MPARTGRASGSGSTAATRTIPSGRSCPTSTPRGCCPLFAPWAVLPWDVAWFLWRVGTILLLLWTIHWAYRRRPLTTAIIIAVLAFPFGANLDTGNINLQLTLDAVGRPVHRSAARRPAVGAGDLDEMGPGRLLADPARPGETLGALLAGRLGRPQPADAAAHDHPAPGAVRLRRAPGQARLPGLPLGRRPVALPQGPTRSTSCGRRRGGAGSTEARRRGVAGSAGRLPG